MSMMIAEEFEKIKKYVEDKGGRIIYTFWDMDIEKGKNIKQVWYLTREGIMFAYFENIFDKKISFSDYC